MGCQISDSEWVKLGTATSALNDCELYFDDTASITVPEMKARARQLKNVDCIVIDYLQLMSSSKKTDNRVQEVSEITRSLKMMAKDLNIPVVVLAQLARTTEGRGKSHKPQLSDLRESGAIEQDADVVLMLYRDAYYNEENGNPAEAEVIVAKNRSGSTGTVKLGWQGEFTKFSNIDYVHEE